MDWNKFWSFWSEPAAPVTVVPPRGEGLRLAATKAKQSVPEAKSYPIQLPEPMKGVVPPGEKSGIAMDDNFCSGYGGFFQGGYIYGDVAGFPGYPRLSSLATRSEYRNLATALSTELTREWIKLNSSETAGESTKKKVTELEKRIEDIGLQQIIQRVSEHDAYFGRGQILVDIKGHKLEDPLILSPKTIRKGSFTKVTTVEPIWTTPAAYNAIDPSAPDFYKPSRWFMLGKQVHSSRLLTVITRPLPDMLKPAFNFGGMSLSQQAEPYVDNWLRTRQSVADLISNFSTTALATSMDQVLTGGDGPACDGTDLFSRADLFTATRSNRGIMLLDKDREELVQLNTPLGGLHELQAQAQEQMCAVGKVPSTVLLGIAPSGFGNVAEGEIKVWENWISANQEAFYRWPIDVVIKILQLDMYGEIDPDITFSFVPLSQMTPKEVAEIRTADATTAGTYIDRGVLDPVEVREKLARDPESGYQGLDMSLEIEPPDQGQDGPEDKKDNEDA